MSAAANHYRVTYGASGGCGAPPRRVRRPPLTGRSGGYDVAEATDDHKAWIRARGLKEGDAVRLKGRPEIVGTVVEVDVASCRVLMVREKNGELFDVEIEKIVDLC